MKIPTPSFRKIRIVIVIILFLMFFFLIGLVKNSLVYAVEGRINNGICYAYKLVKPSNYSVVNKYDEISFDTFPYTRTTHQTGNIEAYLYGSISVYQWVNGNWVIAASTENFFERMNDRSVSLSIQNFADLHSIPLSQTPAQYWPDGPPPECKDPICETERAAKITECGGEDKVDWTTWSDETCSGGECIVPCKDEKQALITQCGGMVNVDWSTFNEETCTGGECKCPTQRELLSQQCGGSEKVDWENFSYATCTGECLPEECTEEQLDLKVKQMLECDGIRYNWNPSTCTGDCEELEPCADKIQQLEASCSNKGYWLTAKGTAENPACEGQCKPNCFDKYEKLASYCSPKSIGWWDDDTCLGGCDKCDKQAKACDTTCQDRGGVAEHDCAMTSSGQVVDTCLCVSDVPKPGIGPVHAPDEEGLDPLAKNDPEIPQDTNPSADPQSNPEDPNAELLEWQKAIKHNNDKLIEQNNQLRNELIKTVNNLDNMAANTGRSIQNQNVNLGVMKNIADNMKANVENTKAIADQLAEGKASDGKKLDMLGAKLDQINANLEGLKDGLPSGDGDTDGYVPGVPDGSGAVPVGDPEGELDGAEDGSGTGDADGNGLADGTGNKPTYETPEHNFSDRTQQFVDEMKTTGLFAIPAEITDIPSGGSSALSISGGDTFGEHTIDFADYGQALLILKSIYLILCSFIAFRIIALKR